MSTLKNKAARAVEEPDKQANTADNRLANGQFAPGQSGNPKGRPRGVRYLSEAFRFALAAKNETNPRETNADAIAAIVVKAALAGDLKACELLLNRTEGKPKTELPNRYDQFSGQFGEDAERLQIEQEIYYEMEDEGLDFDEVMARRDEEEREQEREREKEFRAAKRHLKATEKAFEAADAAIDAGESVDFGELEDEYLTTYLWDRLDDNGAAHREYHARLDLMKKAQASRANAAKTAAAGADVEQKRQEIAAKAGRIVTELKEQVEAEAAKEGKPAAEKDPWADWIRDLKK